MNDHEFMVWAASFLMHEYDRAWRTFGNATVVHKILGIENDAFEIAAWGLPGAQRVVARSMALS